mgnify:CR=1 FL=1
MKTLPIPANVNSGISAEFTGVLFLSISTQVPPSSSSSKSNPKSLIPPRAVFTPSSILVIISKALLSNLPSLSKAPSNTVFRNGIEI